MCLLLHFPYPGLSYFLTYGWGIYDVHVECTLPMLGILIQPSKSRGQHLNRHSYLKLRYVYTERLEVSFSLLYLAVRIYNSHQIPAPNTQKKHWFSFHVLWLTANISNEGTSDICARLFSRLAPLRRSHSKNCSGLHRRSFWLYILATQCGTLETRFSSVGLYQ